MTSVEQARPWRGLPPEVAAVVRPELPALVDEIIEAVADGVAAYARPIDGPFGRGLRVGVEEALRQFVEEIERGGGGRRSDVYVALGRGEMRAGRSLDALLAAYRLGARVAWRRLAAIGTAAGLRPDTLYLLAESVFAYIDELSAESVEGFALEQAAQAGAAQLGRRRMVRLLVQDPPAEPDTVEAAAREAGWPLPRSLAALAIGGPGREAAVQRLPPDAIADAAGDVACVLVPDPDGPGRRALLRRALRDGAAGGLGPTVAWPEAALSFSRAGAVLGLLTAGALASSPGPLAVAAEHGPELLLAGDARLTRDVAGDTLAPLAQLPARSRARLTETLEAWLAEQGRLAPVAERLGVHPQTVRYRLGRLREVLGRRLDEADGRFALELALRARALERRATG